MVKRILAIVALVLFGPLLVAGPVIHRRAAFLSTSAYYGNLTTPYSGSGFYNTADGDGYVVAYKVDLGGSRTGDVAEITMRVSDMDAAFAEAVWVIYDDNGGVPGTILVSTGRFIQGGNDASNETKTVTEKTITSEEVVWIAFFNEAESNATTLPRVYYLTATGGETLTMDLASSEWINDSQEGDSWTDLANNGSAVSETWKMEMQFLLE